MHTRPTGRTPHEIVEVYDTTHCRECGRPLKAPNVSMGTAACTVHGTHRTLTCRACRLVHVDDDCDQTYDQAPLRGHDNGPRGQYGPTADFGDG